MLINADKPLGNLTDEFAKNECLFFIVLLLINCYVTFTMMLL